MLHHARFQKKVCIIKENFEKIIQVLKKAYPLILHFGDMMQVSMKKVEM